MRYSRGSNNCSIVFKIVIIHLNYNGHINFENIQNKKIQPIILIKYILTLIITFYYSKTVFKYSSNQRARNLPQIKLKSQILLDPYGSCNSYRNF